MRWGRSRYVTRLFGLSIDLRKALACVSMPLRSWYPLLMIKPGVQLTNAKRHVTHLEIAITILEAQAYSTMIQYYDTQSASCLSSGWVNVPFPFFFGGCLLPRRRVFDYHTRHVDFDAPAPPLPRCLSRVLREMEERGLKPSRPDQMTLNEYKP